jgi:hypothetical protein
VGAARRSFDRREEGLVIPRWCPQSALGPQATRQTAGALSKRRLSAPVARTETSRLSRHFVDMEGVNPSDPHQSFAGSLQAQHRTRTDDPFLTMVKSGVAGDMSAAKRKWANPSPGAGLRALSDGRPPGSRGARFGAGVALRVPSVCAFTQAPTTAARGVKPPQRARWEVRRMRAGYAHERWPREHAAGGITRSHRVCRTTRTARDPTGRARCPEVVGR